MSHNTWAHRLIAPLVRPLAATPVTPNHLTTVRLVFGIATALCFAAGRYDLNLVAGALHVVSMLLDRADGHLARISGKTSAWGHAYDLFSDNASTTLLFVGIGIGYRAGDLGLWAPLLGVLAGAAIAIIFRLVDRAMSYLPAGQHPVPGGGGFDPDDFLFVVAPLAWFGGLETFLIAAGIGAPVFAVGLVIYVTVLRRRAGAGGPSP